MMAAGVHPAMAAAALLAGTWGSVFNPGLMHVPVIAKIANVPVMEVILGHKTASVAGIIVVAVLLFIEAKLFRQDRDWTPEKAGADLSKAAQKKQEPLMRVNVVRALVPVVPLALLLLTVPQFGLTKRWLPNGLTVLKAMVIETIAGMVVTRTNPTQITKHFFDGMGRAYSLVLGIIIAAGVFIGGLEAAGVINALIETLKKTQSAVPVIGIFGPMLVSVVVGSTDAFILAFNDAVRPHAAQFGMTPVNLGNLALLGGPLGRSISPVATVSIIAAGLAG